MAKNRSFNVDEHLDLKIQTKLYNKNIKFTDYMLNLVRKDILKEENDIEELKTMIDHHNQEAIRLLDQLQTLLDNESKQLEAKKQTLQGKFKDTRALRELVALQEARKIKTLEGETK